VGRYQPVDKRKKEEKWACGNLSIFIREKPKLIFETKTVRTAAQKIEKAWQFQNRKKYLLLYCDTMF
jgi:hypothetical protein